MDFIKIPEEEEKAIDTMLHVYGKIREIDNMVTFMAFIGLVVDQWMVDHNLSDEMAEFLIEGLLKASKEVHKEEGRLEPTMVEVE